MRYSVIQPLLRHMLGYVSPKGGLTFEFRLIRHCYDDLSLGYKGRNLKRVKYW